jgi:hypothetical protein
MKQNPRTSGRDRGNKDIEIFDRAVSELIQRKGGGFFCVVSPKLLLLTNYEIIKSLTTTHKMNGIVICGDRPPRIYQRLEKSRIDLECPLTYLDLYSTINENSDNSDDVVELQKPLNLEGLEDAVDLALQSVAIRYEGQHHFVLFDNVASLLHYFPEKDILAFLKDLGRRMIGLNIYGIYLVPEGSMAIGWIEKLQKVIQNAFGRLK